MSRPLTPPYSECASEHGEDSPSGFPSDMAGAAEEVNKTPSSTSPPSPANSIRVRRDRSSSQREAIRSKQFTNRAKRSDSNPNSSPLGRKKRFQASSLPADHGLKAIEPPHEQALTKMAFAEQQKWITVQQKTFTKW